MNEEIQKIVKGIGISKRFLSEELSNINDPNYYSYMTTHSLIELLMNFKIFERKDEFVEWLSKAKKYYADFIPNEKVSEIELRNIKYYYTFILGLLEGVVNIELLREYAKGDEEYSKIYYKFNKIYLTDYEELIITLMSAGEYGKVKEYCSKVLAIDKRGLVSVISEYLSKKDKGEDYSLELKSMGVF